MICLSFPISKDQSYIVIKEDVLKWINVICNNIDGTRDYVIKGSEAHRNKCWYCLFVKSKKKKVQMNVFIRQKHTQRRENSLMIAKGKGKEG